MWIGGVGLVERGQLMQLMFGRSVRGHPQLFEVDVRVAVEVTMKLGELSL